MASLFSDFLTALGVRHTEEYSDKRFAEMPFQSMYGLANLLKEYGVGTTGVTVEPEARHDAMTTFQVPFLADTANGFAIIRDVSNGKVTYMTQHKTFTAQIDDMLNGWNGIALVAQADDSSIEPDYERHRLTEIATSLKGITLYVLVGLLLGFAMWRTGLYAHWDAWLAVAFNCGGIILSWMLVQKSLGIHNNSAEAVCSVLEAGGCDEIARSAASSFMGIFKWSEVGLAYFSVSLLAMLMFPATLPALAAINILCLPYTIWSISYQKFKAKVWCTLCVFVQVTLWLLFFTYLLGGLTHTIFPLTSEFVINFVVLGCCYLAALLAINALDNALLKYFTNNENA